MRVSIHQPQYIPWLGYFYKILHSDAFVLFDTVQYPRGKNFSNRNLIKTATGVLWLTVPVLKRGDLLPFQDIPVDQRQSWAAKHWRTISLAYRAAPFMAEYAQQLQHLYLEQTWSHIVDLNEAFIEFCLSALNVKVPILRASRLKTQKDGLDTASYIIAILKELKADQYISGQGTGSVRYVEPELFGSHGIEVLFCEFACQPYKQLWSDYVPDLSMLDTVLNCGSNTRSLLEQSGRLVE